MPVGRLPNELVISKQVSELMIRLVASAGALMVQCLPLAKLLAKDSNGLGMPGIEMVMPLIAEEVTLVDVSIDIPDAAVCCGVWQKLLLSGIGMHWPLVVTLTTLPLCV